MAHPRLKYFRIREVGNAIELNCLFQDVNDAVEAEASSVFALLYYQTRNHIKLDLYPVDYIPIGFLNRILNLAIDLRKKKRVLILLGIPVSLYHFLIRFGIQENIFLQRDGLIRGMRNLPSRIQSMEEIPIESQGHLGGEVP